MKTLTAIVIVSIVVLMTFLASVSSIINAQANVIRAQGDKALDLAFSEAIKTMAQTNRLLVLMLGICFIGFLFALVAIVYIMQRGRESHLLPTPTELYKPVLEAPWREQGCLPESARVSIITQGLFSNKEALSGRQGEYDGR